MNVYTINGTESTPNIYLDKNGGIFSITGRSLPENAINVYSPVMSWFEEYSKSPNPETTLDIHFEYINSSSIKQLAKLLTSLEKIASNGGKVAVKWHHAAEDTDTRAYGEHLAKLVSFPIILDGSAN